MLEIIPSQGASNSEEEYKDLSRYAKGYFYEMDVQNQLDTHNISFNGNSRNYTKWLEQTNSGYDIKVNIGNGTINIECKFTLTLIYHSWFIRDWLSRDSDIFVTNNKWNISYSDRRLLDEEHKKLFSICELIIYLQKLMNNGNKYIVFESNNYTNIERTEVKQNVNKTETDKSETLNQYLTDKNIGETDKKEVLSVPKLNCYNCIKRDICDIINQIEHIKSTKPQIYLKQFNIDSSFKVDSIDLERFRIRKKEWLKELGVIQNLQYKCLSKRSYLHLNLHYKLFD